jgi:hypothetical protein
MHTILTTLLLFSISLPLSLASAAALPNPSLGLPVIYLTTNEAPSHENIVPFASSLLSPTLPPPVRSS